MLGDKTNVFPQVVETAAIPSIVKEPVMPPTLIAVSAILGVHFC